MPKTHIERSATIDKPAAEVFASIRDFKQWPPWSPWIIAEPDCALTFADDGSAYSWDGKIIGAGGMEITGEDKDKSIDYTLTFTRPFRSVSAVRFGFEPYGASTRVTWSMDSSLPFFMFFMKKMMEAFIGMDYERGLRNLKDVLESGSLHSKVEFPGASPFPGLAYIGVPTTCPIADMGDHMKADLDKLDGWMKSTGAEPAGKPFAQYTKWDMINKIATYTIGIPLTKPPTPAPDGFVTGEIPACQTYPIRHTGRYDHLGNAWSSGIFHGRSKQFRQSKKIMPFEVYEGDPADTAPDDLVTVVHFPLK